MFVYMCSPHFWDRQPLSGSWVPLEGVRLLMSELLLAVSPLTETVCIVRKCIIHLVQDFKWINDLFSVLCKNMHGDYYFTDRSCS